MAAINGERSSAERAPGSPTARIRVVYLSGTGRSGTTLVANALGSIPGTVSIGEVRYGIRRGLVEDGHCGCQRPVRECPVWVPALEATFGHVPSREEATDLDRALSEATRTRTVARWLAGREDTTAQDLVRVLGDLTAQVAVAAGVRTVVDSSKLPAYGMLLSRHPDLDVRVVQVLRDPRAVAWSWQRSQASHQVSGFEETMERFTPAKTSMMWLSAAWGTQAWGSRTPHGVHTMRYEDFVEAPGPTLDRIARFADIVPSDPHWVDALAGPSSLRLGTSHAMAGNPNRVRTGEIPLRADDEWRRRLPVAQRRAISTLTYPARRSHGY